MAEFGKAIDRLKEHGVDAIPARRGHGVEGRWNDGLRLYDIHLGLNFDAGFEMSVTPEPGPLTWWIHAQTLDELLNMLFEAQADVAAGRAPTWLDALKARDPLRWMDPDSKPP